MHALQYKSYFCWWSPEPNMHASLYSIIMHCHTLSGISNPLLWSHCHRLRFQSAGPFGPTIAQRLVCMICVGRGTWTSCRLYKTQIHVASILKSSVHSTCSLDAFFNRLWCMKCETKPAVRIHTHEPPLLRCHCGFAWQIAATSLGWFWSMEAGRASPSSIPSLLLKPGSTLMNADSIDTAETNPTAI